MCEKKYKPKKKTQKDGAVNISSVFALFLSHISEGIIIFFWNALMSTTKKFHFLLRSLQNIFPQIPLDVFLSKGEADPCVSHLETLPRKPFFGLSLSYCWIINHDHSWSKWDLQCLLSYLFSDIRLAVVYQSPKALEKSFLTLPRLIDVNAFDFFFLPVLVFQVVMCLLFFKVLYTIKI